MSRIIGNPEGFLGDKFDQLTDSLAVIEDAGAFVPETIGISQSVIDEVLVASGLPSIDEASALPKGSAHLEGIGKKLIVPDAISDELIDASCNLAQTFDGPLILRSSGRGDAVGVGVYESRIHGISRSGVIEAFTAVAGSYFTDRAKIYRDRLGLASGFGMLMQPIVGGQITVHDEWPHRREDYDELDIVAKEFCTLSVFGPIVSGNVKIGTPRSMNGLLRLEEGIGSAVNRKEAPILDLSSETYADVLLSMVNDMYIIDHIWFRSGDRVPGGNIAVTNNKGWELSEPDGRYGYVVDENEHMTLDDLRKTVERIQERLGACYVEFALTKVDERDRLYILQLGKLVSNGTNEQPDFEHIEQADVLADRLQAQNDIVTTEPFGKLVRLDDWRDHDVLYLFDIQEAAKDGYLLVYGSRSTHSGATRIDLRRLKNVRGLLELESLDVGRTNGTAEEHLIGYSEQLGIPLLSINYGATSARRSLFGIDPRSGERTADTEDFGGLLIRNGKFRVAGDPQSGLSLVAKC